MDGMRRFSMPILSLVGIGLSGTQDRFLDDGQGVADVSLAYYAAAFRQRPRSVAWFARVVAHYFGTACRAEQFIGQSLLLPSPDRTRIGRHHCRLGVTALCGDQVWSREAGVRLTLGPMRQAAFDAFLPGGVAARRLRCLIRVFSGLSADVEIRLLLDRRDARPIRLGCAAPARLGWTAWIARDESRARPGALPDAGYRIASSSGAQTA
jgi:type VI secretion system protein ImpH